MRCYKVRFLRLLLLHHFLAQFKIVPYSWVSVDLCLHVHFNCMPSRSLRKRTLYDHNSTQRVKVVPCYIFCGGKNAYLFFLPPAALL